MTLLHPWVLLFATAALLPVAGLLAVERRANAVRRAIGEPSPPHGAAILRALCLIAVPALLAVAAAEPVAEQTRRRTEKAGVEAYAVFDTSGSMAASSRPGARSRLERAKRLALELRRSVPGVRIGIASMTDRLLPTLFPTGSDSVFAATVAESVGIERPPPTVLAERASSLDSLGNLADGNFFTARRRLAVVFTDGESAPPTQAVATKLQKAHIGVLFVHTWRSGERIYIGTSPDPNYTADSSSARTLERASTLIGARVFGESDFPAVVSAARRDLSPPATAKAVPIHEGARTPLAQWFVLVSLLPLSALAVRGSGRFERLAGVHRLPRIATRRPLDSGVDDARAARIQTAETAAVDEAERNRLASGV
ncbi:MAG: VWA domain-containing protein [Actinobacteria bacterium]|nr:MAG: VWA domain-containing protein [Actinomycetota bacterium]